MQLKTTNYLILCASLLVLVLLCVASVSAPLRFQSQRAEREQLVQQQLQAIAAAQRKYLARHGSYAPQLRLLTTSGLLDSSSTVIPYSDGELFELETSIATDKQGRAIPIMTCGAQYQQYLRGLDANSIANLIEEANERGQYPGMQVRY